MQRNVTRGRVEEPRNYVFLVFSTDEKIENPYEVLPSIMKGGGDGFRLEKVTILKNPAAGFAI